ncbi:nucleotidyltransferase family protein [Nitrospinota bacterium]
MSAREVFLSLAGRYRLRPEEAERLVLASREASRADWKAVVEETLYRETGGLLCHHLREAGVDPPKALRKEYRWIALSNTMIEAELRRIAPRLEEAGLRVLLIKGTALHQTVYKNPGVRNFEDSDWVLAEQADTERAGRVLGVLGYEPDSQEVDAHWTLGPFIIEFHRNTLGDERVASRVSGLEADSGEVNAEIWARARPSALGEPYLMPAPEDHLLILCAHLMKHNFEPGIWFVDLEALLKETEHFDWEAALERANRWGLLRPLAFAFRNLGALNSDEKAGGRETLLPPEVRGELAAVRPTLLEGFLLALAARGERLYGEKEEWERPPLANLLWLSSHRGLGGKIRLLWEAAFPSGEVMSVIYPAYRPGLRWWFMARRAADLIRLCVRVMALSQAGSR